MAIHARRPYGQFNFLVDLGDGSTRRRVEAGFQEVSGLGMEVTVAEYRAGNAKDNHVDQDHRPSQGRPTSRSSAASSVGTDALRVARRRSATAAPDARSDVITIAAAERGPHQHRDDVEADRRAPMKYTGPTFNGKGTDVAMEELVLAYERLELD